jgi:hypothetical protein
MDLLAAMDRLSIEMDLIWLKRFGKNHVDMLLIGGVDDWNKFRKAKPEFILNLSDADLSRISRA